MNKHFELKKFLNNRTKGYSLMICQTEALFLRHSVDLEITDGTVKRLRAVPKVYTKLKSKRLNVVRYVR